MAEVYTSGEWLVKPGHEAEFVAAWRAMAEWSVTTIEGASWARLVRDRENPSRFVSFGPWASLEAIAVWRAHPGFDEYVGRIRPHLENLTTWALDEAARVG